MSHITMPMLGSILLLTLALAGCGQAAPTQPAQTSPTAANAQPAQTDGNAYPAPEALTATPLGYPAPEASTAYPAPAETTVLGGDTTSQPSEAASASPVAQGTTRTPAAAAQSTTATPRVVVPTVPPVPVGEAPVEGEAPADLVAAMSADLSKRSGAVQTAITVVRSEAVTWNDGAMGCAMPDVAYTQAIIPGYLVVLETGGKQYNYHADTNGTFFLCER